MLPTLCLGVFKKYRHLKETFWRAGEMAQWEIFVMQA